MTSQEPSHNRYPEIGRIFNAVRKSPQPYLVAALFGAGLLATHNEVSTLAGALTGAGATMLGAWIADWNRHRADAEEKFRRQSEAGRYLAPELNRTLERVLYIHSRLIPNFTNVSAASHNKPNDIKDDFIPYWSVLVPNAPQVRDLSGEEAVALIAF